MQVRYREHEINVTREPSMSGAMLVFYSVFRVSDGYECTSGFQDTSDTVREMVKFLKERVDEELASENPWDEHDELLTAES